MQIKKDEVRNAILQAAEEEFLEKGFPYASVRKIVKAAGTTLGNFYNYFDSKESLFDALVESEYELFIELILQHEKLERPDYLWNTLDISQWKKVLSQLMQQLLPPFTRRFILLIECSEGTRYANSRAQLVGLIKDHFVEHMERFSPEAVNIPFAEIIAEQVINGFILILRKFREEEERKHWLIEYLLMYLVGSMGLFEGWKVSNEPCR